MDKQTRARAIMEANTDVCDEWWRGGVDGSHWDGLSYQLYLDLDDDSLMIHVEASDQSWLQRDDGSLIMIDRRSGYCDTPEDELYTDECSPSDYGYTEAMDEIERLIAEHLPQDAKP